MIVLWLASTTPPGFLHTPHASLSFPPRIPRLPLLPLQYYTSPDTVMEKVGISTGEDKTGSIKDDEELECRICCDEFTAKEAYALTCNHFFCRGCWAAYLGAKV